MRLMSPFHQQENLIVLLSLGKNISASRSGFFVHPTLLIITSGHAFRLSYRSEERKESVSYSTRKTTTNLLKRAHDPRKQRRKAPEFSTRTKDKHKGVFIRLFRKRCLAQSPPCSDVDAEQKKERRAFTPLEGALA